MKILNRSFSNCEKEFFFDIRKNANLSFYADWQKSLKWNIRFSNKPPFLRTTKASNPMHQKSITGFNLFFTDFLLLKFTSIFCPHKRWTSLSSSSIWILIKGSISDYNYVVFIFQKLNKKITVKNAIVKFTFYGNLYYANDKKCMLNEWFFDYCII